MKYSRKKSILGTILQKYKTGNEKKVISYRCSPFLSSSTSQNLGMKSVVKMEDYKPRNWLDW